MYDNEIFANMTVTAAQRKLVIGGEAALWSSYSDRNNWDPQVWPRASAVAERLWSPQTVDSTTEAEPRLVYHRCRMVSRGIRASPISSALLHSLYRAATTSVYSDHYTCVRSQLAGAPACSRASSRDDGASTRPASADCWCHLHAVSQLSVNTRSLRSRLTTTAHRTLHLAHTLLDKLSPFCEAWLRPQALLLALVLGRRWIEALLVQRSA